MMRTIFACRGRKPRAGVLVAGLAMCGAMAGASVPLSAQQLGYTLVPTATRISWDDKLPLQDDWMYGGRLSLVFGSQVELQPFFLRGNRFGVDSARGASVFGAGSLNRSLC